MAANISICDICNNRHISKQSTHWCQDCGEALCSDCIEHHTLSKATRRHTTISITDYEKLPSFITNIKPYCEKHNEKYLLYCQKHECPMCYKCVQSHAKCAESVIPLENVTENSKKSQMFHDLTQSISDLETNIMQIRKSREDNLEKVTLHSKETLAKIREYRERVNCHLDSIEQKLIEKSLNVESKCGQKIKDILKTLQEVEVKLSYFSSTLKTIKQHASELQVFFAIREIEKQVMEKEHDLNTLLENKRLDDFTISLEIDTKIENILSDIKMFGTITVETIPVNAKFINQKYRQAQILANVVQPFDNIKFRQIRKFDSGARQITGCTIIPDGRMAFTEYLGKRLVIRNADGTLGFKIPLKESDVFDVTVINDATVAVSCGAPDRNGKTSLQVIDVNLRKNIKVIDTKSWSYGLVCVDEKLVFSGYDPDGIYKVDLKTNQTTVIESTFSLNTWSYISCFENKFYLTNDCNNTVTCCDNHGNVKWAYKDEMNMKIPRAISVDKNGNVFVACKGSNNVIVILPDGSRAKQILGNQDGLEEPCALHYDRTTNRLLVTNYMGTAFLLEAI